VETNKNKNMGTIETGSLISVSELSAVRTIIGAKSATDQAIRNQVRQIEKKEKTPKQVGFEVVTISQSSFFLKITDNKIESFRQKLNKWVSTNKP
jgi:hypothetical protein